MQPNLEPATHLVSAADGATALCRPCTQLFTRLMSLLNSDNEVYELQDPDEPIVCQLCYLDWSLEPQQPTKH
jgi:hypothetical protein